MVHSTSLPSIASKPSEIPVTCELASPITSLNCSNLPMTPSPPDSPNVSSVVVRMFKTLSLDNSHRPFAMLHLSFLSVFLCRSRASF